MMRWLRRGLVSVSGLLMVLAAVGWARAQRACDVAEWTRVGGAGGNALHDVNWSFVGWRDAAQFGLDQFWHPSEAEAARARSWDVVRAGFRWEASEPRSWTAWPPPPGAFPVQDSAAWLGFSREHGESSPPQAEAAGERTSREVMTLVTVPWWGLLGAFALMPAWVAWRRGRARWRRRRRGRNGCQGCGYDLRATADAAGPLLGICPECGRENG